MADRKVLDAYAKNKNVNLYRDSDNRIVISKYQPYSCPQWFRDRDNAKKDSSSRFKGTLDGHGGNKIHISNSSNNKMVISGYKPYSHQNWFNQASSQGYDDYSDGDSDDYSDNDY